MISEGTVNLRLINTHDQLTAAGGDRVAFIYQTQGYRTMRVAGWHVAHVVNGAWKTTDARAAWYDRGLKFFDARHPIREGKKAALAEAIAWAEARYGTRDYVPNRLGDYVEREVNARLPIRRTP